jgi:hypothetical protein
MTIPFREINVTDELRSLSQLLAPHRQDPHPAVSLAIKHFDAFVLAMKLAQRVDEERVREPQEGTILVHLSAGFGTNGSRLRRLPIVKIHKQHIVVKNGEDLETFRRLGGIHIRKGYSKLGNARLDGGELAMLNKKAGEGVGE